MKYVTQHKNTGQSYAHKIHLFIIAMYTIYAVIFEGQKVPGFSFSYMEKDNINKKLYMKLGQ